MIGPSTLGSIDVFVVQSLFNLIWTSLLVNNGEGCVKKDMEVCVMHVSVGRLLIIFMHSYIYPWADPINSLQLGPFNL